MKTPILLCLETSTQVCSVCVSSGPEVLAIRETHEMKSHTEKITCFIDECLRAAQLTVGDVSAVCISSGPGSYTGLRIGASTAKGLCYGLDIPLIGINSLVALYSGVDTHQIKSDDVIVTAIDARREEVYALVMDAHGRVLEDTTSIVLTDDHILTSRYGDRTLHLAGNGADKCKALLPHNSVVHAQNASARYLLPPGLQRFNAGEFNELVSFSPNYFKNPNITLSKKNRL